ncbi:COMM domain-containing protein 3-like [Uloborus diversus]|uniref:COMM domain-containing protein 3-like n=1 Tax=Uloborus diversus TaxID=327109 RepID=UPI002409FE5C|nr:COMM domain-containing protein 3-like [Uloborus diversus]
MEISRNILAGISIAADNSVLSDNLFDFILNDVFEVACGKSPLKESEKQIVDPDHKTTHSALLSFVLEAAKNDANGPSISATLEECGMDTSRISALLSKYQEKKDMIQLQLSLVGRSHDRIIDVKWRQDYVIKSNNCEKICELNYLITLKTWNSCTNTEKDITFSCSMEQLQDLVLKLKDVSKCIDRNAA